MVPMANRILLTCVAMALLPRTAVCGNVRTLVDQRPIATTGSTKLKYEINFNQEGEYAISAWVWLWKQSHPPEYVLPIFTSHIMDDFMTKSGADEMDSPRHTSALTPSMLYNGAVPEHFFFSASRDDNGNYANGFWGVDPVRYHEWMHVTFFMIDGRYSVYIDGKFQGSSSLFHPVRQFSAPLVSVNETIFFLGAASYGRSASAMFQQVHILSGEEARTDPQLLAVAYPPLRSSILYKLMREYNMFTLDEFTPVKFLGSFYGEMQWGLCPFSVCGAMCIDEAFYFTAHSTIRPSRTIPDIGNRGNKLDDLHKVVDRNSAVKTTAVKEKTVRKHKATDRQVLKSLAKRLKDAVLDQLDTIDLDPYGYDDYGALYLDDELLGVPAELLTDLDALSDAELNSINMWVEASLEGYEMNIDEYFDAIEGNGDEELIDGVDTSSNQHIISPVGYTMDYKGNIESSFGADTDEVLLKTYKRSSIVKDRSSSILPKRPKWKSRFLGSKKMVLTDEEIRGNNSISKIIVEQIQKIKFADNLYLIYKWLKGLVYNLEQPDHIRIQDSVTELDVSESVGSISSPETIDIGSFDYYEMYRALQPDIDDSVIQVQELYDSAMLWLNGRHTGFISHAHIGMYDWIKYSHAYSEAALFLALWLSFDVQLKELYSKNLMTEISVLDPLSHPIHLALAFRAGFSSKIVSDAFFMPKSFSGYQRSRHLTQFNTDYLSHLFGIEYSRSESDLSLHHALGGVGLADILKTNGAGKGDELDASLQAVKEAEITCDISVAYYFSVAQYVVNYFGQIETGVGKPEELRLADGLAPLELYEGEDALLHEVNAVEADGGNADAQMWMVRTAFILFCCLNQAHLFNLSGYALFLGLWRSSAESGCCSAVNRECSCSSAPRGAIQLRCSSSKWNCWI